MARDLGLPAVPRGLDRNLTFFLQNLLDVVGGMSGLTPGSSGTRVVRVNETNVYRSGSGGGSGSGATLGAQSVVTSYIQNMAVTTEKIAPAAVTAPKLADNAVGTKHIAKQAVTSEKLAVGAVTGQALADGCVTTGRLADSVITTEKLLDNAVTTAKIENDAITTDKIKDSAIVEAKIDDGAVSTSKIAHRAITAIKLAEGVLPVIANGTASNGETVTLPGVWLDMPLVAISSLTPPADWEAGNVLGAVDMAEQQTSAGQSTGVWSFTAAGDFAWAAIGYAGEELLQEEEPESGEEGGESEENGEEGA